jgi:hypothetical protein
MNLAWARAGKMPGQASAALKAGGRALGASFK